MPQPPNRISTKRQGPLPIVLGVTGHRDLRPEDLKLLEAVVRGIIVEIATKHPHTPLVLLSPLAEGADRLAARVALELGIRLIVPMPLPRELYERDFQRPASRTEFDSLLSQGKPAFQLPLLPGYTEEAFEPGRSPQSPLRSTRGLHCPA